MKTCGRSRANASASIDVHEDTGHGPSNVSTKRMPTTKTVLALEKCRSKNAMKKTLAFRSPFLVRQVNISKRLTKTDMKCGIYALLNNVADDEDVLFAHDSVEILKKHMYTLSKNNFIGVGVVDAWCVMLNHSERSRSAESPARFFPSTFVCTDALVQTGLTNSMRRDSFFENMSIELEANKHVDLKVIDIFVFPVCKDKRFFAICADMRTGKIIVLDNMNVVATDCQEDKYGTILINLGESLKKGNIEIPVIEWGDKKDSVDSGVYLMRHMETFMGDLSAWSPEITARTAKQMMTMRIRYCTEIMSWQHNLVRESVMMKAQIRYDEVCADPTIKVETLLFG
ncbi:hypothetical protein OROMI_000350 [Orobanche minor]